MSSHKIGEGSKKEGGDDGNFLLSCHTIVYVWLESGKDFFLKKSALIFC